MTEKKKEVVQLCNYGAPRILRADCAEHVATGRMVGLRDTSPLLCGGAWFPDRLAPLLSAAMAEWDWENKSGERD